jgi:ankyrin repeat protein
MEGFNTPEIVSAVHYKNPDEVAEVLRKGLNPDTAEQELYDALISACYGRNIKIVEMLLEAGAKPNLPDQGYLSPLHIAGNEDTVEIVELLLKAKADVHLVDKWGETPLFKSVNKTGKYALHATKLLLAAGALVQGSSRAPILYGIFPQNIDVVPLLINAGTDINEKNKDGDTLLHKYASWNRSDEMFIIIQRLLKWGADPHIVNNAGKTALDLVKEKAIEEENPLTISFLEKEMRKPKWWRKLLLLLARTFKFSKKLR